MVRLLNRLLHGSCAKPAPEAAESPDETPDEPACCSSRLGPPDSAHTTTLSGCGHAFHSGCIVVALQHNRACPLCRYVPPGDQEESDDEQDADPVREHPEVVERRRRAIRSSMMRVRHGSASDEAVAAAGRYRSLGERLPVLRASWRFLEREVRSEHRGLREEVQKLIRRRRRLAMALHRRWWRCREQLDETEQERRRLGDVLAAEASR